MTISGEVNVRQGISSEANVRHGISGDLQMPRIVGGGSITVDSELSSTSENPVQNKVITAALNEKQNIPDNEGTTGQVLTKTDQGAIWEDTNIPDSAWIHKTASGDIATFDDGADDVPIKALIVGIEPVQSGSGDPSPENLRPITGWTGASIVRSPTQNAADGAVYSVSWETEAGMVYGGTLNVTTGVLTVDRFIRRLDALSFSLTGGVFRANGGYTEAKSARDGLCSHYPPSSSGVPSRAEDPSIAFRSRNWDANNRIFVKDSRFSTVADFKAWCSENNVQYVTRFSPVVYQLTPVEIKTLLGQNNIWADCGTADVTYCADATIAYDTQQRELAAIREMLADVEASGVATKNYTAGELLIVDDTLYKVTTNIASGGAITEGVNVTPTTMAAQLALLADNT